MAEATIVTGTLKLGRSGRRRHASATLDAPADGDTWTVPLKRVDSVQLTHAEDATASDAVQVSSVSSNVITLNVVGTARDVYATVYGV